MNDQRKGGGWKCKLGMISTFPVRTIGLNLSAVTAPPATRSFQGYWGQKHG